jgi:hypothetical protein
MQRSLSLKKKSIAKEKVKNSIAKEKAKEKVIAKQTKLLSELGQVLKEVKNQ